LTTSESVPLSRMILDKRFALIFALLSTVACTHTSSSTPSPSASGKLLVVASTSTLASLVKSVGGDAAEVHWLVPIGASPETYEPAPKDVIEVSHAAVIIENGSGLEAWLSKLLAEAPPKARIVVLSNSLPSVVAHPSGNEYANPHFWLDPHYAEAYVAAIAAALANADPAHAAYYRANALAEQQHLKALDVWIRQQIATIPPSRRAMIADHDAWYYFDRRYGIDDAGAIEKSPGKEPSAADLVALIAQAKTHNVHAIFAEPEFSPRLAKQLADAANIKTVTDLYDDSLGTSPGLDSYDGMMRHDVNTLVQALK
jgi:zinc/manganese transport system substrate-binding protein